MDTISLKKYIYENNKIEYILKEIGCNHIKYHPNKEYYSCSNYNGDNQGAINVKNNEYLNVVNYTRTKEFQDGSDIITLVQYNKDMPFVEAIKYIHKILGLSFEFKKRENKPQKKFNPIGIFERIRNKRKYGCVNVDDIHVLDDEILQDYIPMLHIDWVRQGITERTRKKFGLAYSYKHKRVVIPMRYWLTGELLGFNQRTTVQNYDEFGIKKYFITPTYPKQLNLYALYENSNSIQNAGYVVVYEAEKSVLKRDSLNDATGVALSGHVLSEEQATILSGLDVEVVFAFDKDVRIEEVWYSCDKIYSIKGRKVSYIQDKWDILSAKDSPADACNKDFQFLFDNRIVYGIEQHEKYQKSLKKK